MTRNLPSGFTLIFNLHKYFHAAGNHIQGKPWYYSKKNFSGITCRIKWTLSPYINEILSTAIERILGVYTYRRVQSGKTYRAAFCAALFAGSCINVAYNCKEKGIDSQQLTVRDTGWCMYVCRKTWIFYCTVEKTSLSLPAESLSCLYIQWFVDKMRFVDKMCLRTDTYCVSRENKGFGNLLWDNFVRRENVVAYRENWKSILSS